MVLQEWTTVRILGYGGLESVHSEPLAPPNRPREK